MSCKNCDNKNGERIAYYRWRTANVGLLGCPEHIKEIMTVLNEWQKEQIENIAKSLEDHLAEGESKE